MFRSKLHQATNLVRPMLNQPSYHKQIIPQKQGYATYRVDDAKAMNTTHEQAQVNPLLGDNVKHTFQHPAYVRSVCDYTYCKDTVCKKPCGPVIEEADVGHATHSSTYPNVKYVSSVDSKGAVRPEYMVVYNPPIENVTGGLNLNKEKTENFNNNQEALHNVHLNSSRQPTQKAYQGSDDISNIN